MAKWGEGDPRWIVEERPDATNVNNWHWSDKDASGWSKDKLKSLLVGVTVEGREGKCEVVEVASCAGEATANNRKGKLIFFYDWQIKLKWEGAPVGVTKDPSPSPVPSSSEEDTEDKEDAEEKNEGGEKKKKKKKKKNKNKNKGDYSGEIEIPNLSEENEVDEIDVIVTIKKKSSQSQNLKELMHRESPSIIRKCLGEYLRCLKEEYSKDLILPKRDNSQPASTTRQSSVPQTQTQRQDSLPAVTTPKSSGSRPSGSPVGCRIYTAKINMTESFLASVEDLYNTFTEKELVVAFTQSKCTVEAHRGGLFSMMDGMISGEFMECTRPSKIVQKWRLKSWPEGHYSTVNLEFKQNATSAEISLIQTEVPEAESLRTREGWQKYIFQRIKATFGYGSQLF